jgi:BNR/Asp-box repeat
VNRAYLCSWGLVLTLSGCASAAPLHNPTLPPGERSASPSAVSTPEPTPTANHTGFAVEGISFVGGRAFAIGSLGSATLLEVSDDAGASWHIVGKVPVSECTTNVCVSYRLEFGSSEVGYAYGDSELLVTHDGGHHWTQQQSALDIGTIDLAVDGPAAAIRAFGGGPCGCVLEYTTNGGATWRSTGVSPISGSNSGDRVRMQSDIAYATQLGNPAGGGEGGASIYVSTDQGKTWDIRATPCGALPLIGDMAATSGHVVSVLCVDRTTQPFTYTLRISGDGAQTFGAASAPVPGAMSSGTLAIASSSVAAVANGSGVFVTTDRGAHWHRTLSCFAGWLGFESTIELHVLCGNTLWRSNNAGKTWSSYTFS